MTGLLIGNEWSNDIKSQLNPPKSVGLTLSNLERILSPANATNVPMKLEVIVEILDGKKRQLARLAENLGQEDPRVKILKNQMATLRMIQQKYSVKSFDAIQKKLLDVRETIEQCQFGFSIVADIDGHRITLVTTDESK